MHPGGDTIESKNHLLRRSPTPVHRFLVAALAAALALALSTVPQAGDPADVASSNAAATTEVVALRAKSNNKYVAAENAGNASLIANRTAIGSWETFDLIHINSANVYLRSHANGKYVCAESAGAAPLISDRDVPALWETFQLINNSDGTKSLRSLANNELVTAESAGAAPLIANRRVVGPWEKFDVIAVNSPGQTATPPSTSTPTPTSSPSACPAGQVGTPPNCLPAPSAPAADGKKWRVLFHDEFEGNSLNTSNFTPCFDWNYGDCTDSFNNGKEHYDPVQVRVGGGTAKLVAEPLSPPLASSSCYQGSCTYKAGLISTARPNAGNGSAYLHPFTYGYIESRLKYPAVSGIFTAFWMLPTDPTYNYRNEIDIAEILGGDPDTIFMTYHYNNRDTSYALNTGDNNNAACAVRDYSKDFVRIGLDWEPTYIAWYIDGVKCGQFNGNSATIESGPMQIIMHTMVDNNWERNWGLTLANQSITAQLEVDYLRVYQLS